MQQKKRVTGIGGIFFNSPNPDRLRAWYKEHLGIDVRDWGGAAIAANRLHVRTHELLLAY